MLLTTRNRDSRNRMQRGDWILYLRVEECIRRKQRYDSRKRSFCFHCPLYCVHVRRITPCTWVPVILPKNSRRVTSRNVCRDRLSKTLKCNQCHPISSQTFLKTANGLLDALC